ncbi:MAG TPA: DUF5131 family protein [Streptosporangiaceae bacterium]
MTDTPPKRVAHSLRTISARQSPTPLGPGRNDLGHARVTREFLARVWATMTATPQHTYQNLTKRPERLRRILSSLRFHGEVQAALDALAADGKITPVRALASWPLPNVWTGTSIEMDRYTRRADELRETLAAVRFLSLEPLLGPLPSLKLTGVDWAIIGGESGPDARPLDLGWVRDLIARCDEAGTAVFVKQLGTCWARDHGSAGKGTDPARWPADLRRREFPSAAAARRRGPDRGA